MRVVTTEVFTYDELSDHTKEHARDDLRVSEYPFWDWWDAIYEDAKHVGELIGINVVDIRFSGFYCQGSGAAFNGSYRFTPDALENLEEEWGDGGSLAVRTIAQELHKLCAPMVVRARMMGEPPLHISSMVDVSNNCDHSAGMQAEIESLDFPESVSDAQLAALVRGIQTQMRLFADWIYKCLEEEYEYLMGDESTGEFLQVNEYEFTEDGSRA